MGGSGGALIGFGHPPGIQETDLGFGYSPSVTVVVMNGGDWPDLIISTPGKGFE